MKLYDIPRNTKIKVVGDSEVLQFQHLDGMYALCKTKTGEAVHLARWTDVEIVKEEV